MSYRSWISQSSWTSVHVSQLSQNFAASHRWSDVLESRLVNHSRTRISLLAEVINISRPDKQVTKLTSASWIPEKRQKLTRLHRVFWTNAPPEIFLLSCFFLKHSACNTASVLGESLRGTLQKKVCITRGESFQEQKFPSRRQPHHSPLKINTNNQTTKTKTSGLGSSRTRRVEIHTKGTCACSLRET